MLTIGDLPSYWRSTKEQEFLDVFSGSRGLDVFRIAFDETHRLNHDWGVSFAESPKELPFYFVDNVSRKIYGEPPMTFREWCLYLAYVGTLVLQPTLPAAILEDFMRLQTERMVSYSDRAEAAAAFGRSLVS